MFKRIFIFPVGRFADFPADCLLPGKIRECEKRLNDEYGDRVAENRSKVSLLLFEKVGSKQ